MKVRMTAMLMTALLLIATVGTQTAFAANGIVIRAADTHIASCRAIEVPVLAENNSGFASLMLKLSYDPSLLKPVSVTKGDLLAGQQDGQLLANLAHSDHEIKLVYAASTDVCGDGVVARVAFEALGDAAFTTEIGLDVLFLDDGGFASPAFEQRSGTLEVEERLPLTITAPQGADERGSEWTNRTENTLSDVILAAAAYDADGKMTALTMRRHTFAPHETFTLSLPAGFGAGSDAIRLFAMTAAFQPAARHITISGR